MGFIVGDVVGDVVMFWRIFFIFEMLIFIFCKIFLIGWFVGVLGERLMGDFWKKFLEYSCIINNIFNGKFWEEYLVFCVWGCFLDIVERNELIVFLWRVISRVLIWCL